MRTESRAQNRAFRCSAFLQIARAWRDNLRMRLIQRVVGPKILIALYILFATWHSVTLPVFEAEDEASHFLFAHFIAENGRLPDVRNESPSHEATQPPLYYAVVAALIAPIDRTDLAQHTVVHDDQTDPAVNERGRVEVRDRYLHLAPQNWPYQRSVLALHAARLINTAFGALTLTLCMAFARALGPHVGLDPMQASWWAGALLALNPKFAYLGGIVGNDMQMGLFSTAAALLLFARWRAHSIFRALVIGLLIGCAALSKLPGIALAPVALLGMTSWRNRAILTIGIVAVLAPWLIHNITLYGDPLAVRETAMLHINNARTAPLGIGDIVAHSFLLIGSSWSMIGYAFTMLPLPPQITLYLLVFVCVIGLIALLIQVRRTLATRAFWLRPAGALLLWCATAYALFFAWFLRYDGTANARLLLAAVAPACLAVCVGMRAFSRVFGIYGRLLRAGAPALPLMLLGISIATPGLWLPALFSPPAQVAATPASLGRFDNGIDVRDARVTRTADGARVTLHWGATEPLTRSYKLQLNVVDSAGATLTQWRSLPDNGRYSTLYWEPGRYHVEHIDLVFDPARAPASTSLRLYSNTRAAPQPVWSRWQGEKDALELPIEADE